MVSYQYGFEARRGRRHTQTFITNKKYKQKKILYGIFML